MRIDWSTLALQTVNALVLVWLLARFLFRPVADIVAARQKAAQALIADADASRHEAQAEHAAARAETARLAASRALALKAVEAEAETRKAALVAAAQDEAARLRADAQADIARSRAAGAQAASDDAVRLAVDIAQRLLDRLPPQARVQGFIGGVADALAKLPPAVRDELGAHGRPVGLAAPRALSADEQHACEAALTAALGRPVAVQPHVDPSLIAGLELTGPDVVVRNHLRHDLDVIRTTLLEHDDDGRR